MREHSVRHSRIQHHSNEATLDYINGMTVISRGPKLKRTALSLIIRRNDLAVKQFDEWRFVLIQSLNLIIAGHVSILKLLPKTWRAMVTFPEQIE
jgi:hypothetical protein